MEIEHFSTILFASPQEERAVLDNNFGIHSLEIPNEVRRRIKP
jgi:hypothetical protein